MGCCASSDGGIERPSGSVGRIGGRIGKGPKPTLGYWSTRGMGAQCTYLLAYCDVDFNFKQYVATYENGVVGRGTWPDEKFNLGIGFPNLPYFIDGDVKIAETMPLMRYICRKYKPELLGKTLEERAQVDMIGAVVNDLKVSGCMVPCYVHGDRDKIDQDCTQRLEPIVKWLGEKKFLMGNDLCYVDFVLFECICVIEFVTNGRVFTDYPTLKTYSDEIKSITSLQSALAAAEMKAFNNPMAKLNDK